MEKKEAVKSVFPWFTISLVYLLVYYIAPLAHSGVWKVLGVIAWVIVIGNISLLAICILIIIAGCFL